MILSNQGMPSDRGSSLRFFTFHTHGIPLRFTHNTIKQKEAAGNARQWMTRFTKAYPPEKNTEETSNDPPIRERRRVIRCAL